VEVHSIIHTEVNYTELTFPVFPVQAIHLIRHINKVANNRRVHWLIHWRFVRMLGRVTVHARVGVLRGRIDSLYI